MDTHFTHTQDVFKKKKKKKKKKKITDFTPSKQTKNLEFQKKKKFLIY